MEGPILQILEATVHCIRPKIRLSTHMKDASVIIWNTTNKLFHAHSCDLCHALVDAEGPDKQNLYRKL